MGFDESLATLVIKKYIVNAPIIGDIPIKLIEGIPYWNINAYTRILTTVFVIYHIFE